VEPEKTPRERAEDLISLLVSDWRPTPRQSLWGIRIATVLVVLIAIGYAYSITLWDWAKLLIVPAAIAFAGLWFNAQQKEREQNLAREHAQDEALQSYFDQMGRLLLDKDMELGKSKEGDEVRTLARAWTLTVLTRLGFDGLRKRSVVQFLYEAKLITKDHIALDLREAYLNFAKLNGSDFYLTRVNLHGASLTKATMNAINLVEADLSDTRMFGANLLLANLRRADMSRAVLMSSNTDSIPLPRSSVTENYSFDSPGPKNANLRLTDLREVDLTDAYVSEEQLLSAASLAGATMPNGQKYEDWLKDKNAQGG
jgi:uncharacterized protein YjbI with pentapeptide repeats